MRYLTIFAVLSLLAACGAGDEAPDASSPESGPATTTTSAPTPVSTTGTESPLLTYPRSCWSRPTQAECAAMAPDEGETFMAAEVEGQLSIRDRCVYLTYAGGDHPVIFPHGTAWDDADQAVVLNGGQRLHEGDWLLGGGGGVHLRPDADEWYGPELAAGLRRCLANPRVTDTIAELGWSGGVDKIEPPTTAG